MVDAVLWYGPNFLLDDTHLGLAFARLDRGPDRPVQAILAVERPDGDERVTLGLGDEVTLGEATWALTGVERTAERGVNVTLHRVSGPALPQLPPPPSEPEPVRVSRVAVPAIPDLEPEPEPWPVPLPVRTRDEALMYMDLHSCARCGSGRTAWQSGLTTVDGRLARGYSGSCQGCGRLRRFRFWSIDPKTVHFRSSYVDFGGPEPSRIIDAGEWLWMADLTASRVPVDDPDRARHVLSIAVAAMGEILKFIPSEAHWVPEEGFWSERGRRMHAQEPGRFGRDVIGLVRGSYEEALNRVTGGTP